MKTHAPTQVRAPFPEHSSTPSASRARGPAALQPAKMAADLTQEAKIMNATNNPQAATAVARASYRQMMARLGVLELDTAIPESVRALPFFFFF